MKTAALVMCQISIIFGATVKELQSYPKKKIKNVLGGELVSGT
jgi:hypothetical protein